VRDWEPEDSSAPKVKGRKCLWREGITHLSKSHWKVKYDARDEQCRPLVHLARTVFISVVGAKAFL
jgi:hypothetical protein